jgi:hypothetical protein
MTKSRPPSAPAKSHPPTSTPKPKNLPPPTAWDEEIGYPQGSRVTHLGAVWEARSFARHVKNDHDGPGAAVGEPGLSPCWRASR